MHVYPGCKTLCTGVSLSSHSVHHQRPTQAPPPVSKLPGVLWRQRECQRGGGGYCVCCAQPSLIQHLPRSCRLCKSASYSFHTHTRAAEQSVRCDVASPPPPPTLLRTFIASHRFSFHVTALGDEGVAVRESPLLFPLIYTCVCVCTCVCVGGCVMLLLLTWRRLSLDCVRARENPLSAAHAIPEQSLPPSLPSSRSVFALRQVRPFFSRRSPYPPPSLVDGGG